MIRDYRDSQQQSEDLQLLKFSASFANQKLTRMLQILEGRDPLSQATVCWILTSILLEPGLVIADTKTDARPDRKPASSGSDPLCLLLHTSERNKI